MLFTNLRSENRRSVQRAAGSKQTPTRLRPRMESLENRAMLTTFTVTNLDDAGPGSLRDAVDDANAAAGADVIEFDVEGTIQLADEILINDDLTINGPSKDKLTVSGNDATRVFRIAGADVQMNRLTVADGFVNDAQYPFPGVGGGAVLVFPGSLNLDQVVMRDNVSPNGSGGAIFSLFGTLDVTHSSFENNLAANDAGGGTPIAGGAIANVFATAKVSHSRFFDNEIDAGVAIGLGGAISNTFNGSLDVTHSVFQGNSVRSDGDARGGAIGAGFGLGSDVITVDHSQFVHNSVQGDSAIGGAIWADVSSFTLDHSSVVNNQAIGVNAQGGGIYNAGLFTLSQSNINANRAIGEGGDGVGGGIYNAGTFQISRNSNVHANEASTSNDEVFGDLDVLEELLAV